MLFKMKWELGSVKLVYYSEVGLFIVKWEVFIVKWGYVQWNGSYASSQVGEGAAKWE